ncbi:MAG TPA: choice-of-anchor tandem repeat GloVer-containing protein [Terriglobales bacterium]
MLRRKALVFSEITLVLVGLTVSALAADTTKVLYSFPFEGRGAYPVGGVISDAAGNLYGIVPQGGGCNSGAVFQLVRVGSGWAERVLHSFCYREQYPDGSYPFGALIFDSVGNLYGTTAAGGSAHAGIVFELSPWANDKWTEKILYSFCSATKCADGNEPMAGLVFDAAGNLYGTTEIGGAYGAGTVFQLAPGPDGNWTEKTLYSFCALAKCADGWEPLGKVTLDSAGNIYGTTWDGGLHNNPGCSTSDRLCGAVFELIPGTGGNWTEKVLLSFNFRDGGNPGAGLVFDSAGNLYGTAKYGGPYGNGVVFELSPGAHGAWTETLIHAFSGYAYPLSTLVFDPAGNLYGTAEGGNGHGNGIVFELSPGQVGSWTQKVLHSFDGTDGQGPMAGVTFDAAGNLYGTTVYGGTYNDGTVFEITP